MKCQFWIWAEEVSAKKSDVYIKGGMCNSEATWMVGKMPRCEKHGDELLDDLLDEIRRQGNEGSDLMAKLDMRRIPELA